MAGLCGRCLTVQNVDDVKKPLKMVNVINTGQINVNVNVKLSANVGS